MPEDREHAVTPYMVRLLLMGDRMPRTAWAMTGMNRAAPGRETQLRALVRAGYLTEWPATPYARYTLTPAGDELAAHLRRLQRAFDEL